MKTQIIATIGPATLDEKIFTQTVEAGVDIIRINTAYGSYAQYDQILANLKKVSRPVKVMFDIKKNEVLDYLNKNNLDFVALSFTETLSQIQEVRKIAPHAQIISKIESRKGVENFYEILKGSEGVMIARGDLGVAVSLEKVPCLQKKFTMLSLKEKKYVIAATEMLLSMQNSKTPTRAEVSDVANAVFDGVDAVMLSEETAIGKYPVESVTFMKKIIVEAENCDWD